MSNVRALPAERRWVVGARVVGCGGSSNDGNSAQAGSPASGSRERFDRRGVADHERQLAQLWGVS